MVTNRKTGSIYDKGRQARSFIVKIWTKTIRKKDATSYENLTEDRDPSVPREIDAVPSTSTSSGAKDASQDVELQEIQPWDGSVLGEDCKRTPYKDTASVHQGAEFGSLMSGFAALGINNNQPTQTPNLYTTCGLSAQSGHSENPRTSYYHDTMPEAKDDETETAGVLEQDINKNTVTTSANEAGPGLRFDDKDWKLYYGKKGKKKLRKKVLLQVNKSERTLERECYVQLEEEPEGKKKKKKKKRVMSTKARKRAKRAGILAWKGLKISWKYLKNGLIIMTDSPGNALNVSNIAKLYVKPNTEGYDRHSYTTYKSY